MSLAEEVDNHRKSIRTDGYPMSIGELSSMYKEGEIHLHPEFQRFFRWSAKQKSRLVESLLLGIPIPSIFVHQREDGVWDVVDGLQRLSAIFEVMGILVDENKQATPPLVLQSTKYLPSLEGKRWDDEGENDGTLGGTLQRVLKRAKLDIKIVLRESDSDTRLELFQRLNTGGSPLSGQELRNCQIIMVNPSILEVLKEMSCNEDFQNCTALSDRNIDEQYDVELVVRFVTLRKMDAASNIGDIGPFLDDKIVELAENPSFDWDTEKDIFSKTFRLINESCGDDAFRRYNSEKGKFLGGFSVSAFEVLALGLGFHVEDDKYTAPDLREVAQKAWSESDVIQSMKGRRSGERLRNTLTLGREILTNEDKNS